jgi:hypothetical protein
LIDRAVQVPHLEGDRSSPDFGDLQAIPGDGGDRRRIPERLLQGKLILALDGR